MAEFDSAGDPATFLAMTLNLMAQGVVTTGFADWPERRAICARELPALGADLVGLQECLPQQQRDIIAAFPQHDSALSDLTVADEAFRAAFRQKRGLELPDTGEMHTLWRRDRFEFIARREGWLSPTPDRISAGFGAVTPRALLLVHLRDRYSGRDLWVANTHVDLRCPAAMAPVGVDLLARWIPADQAALWFGDFNAGLSTPTAMHVRSGGWDMPRTERDGWRGERVDHIWRRGPGLQRLDTRVVASQQFQPALSDHDPVLSRFRWTDPTGD